MKNPIIIFLISCAVFALSFTTTEKNPSSTTIQFWVAGTCGLCEETIEKSLDIKGIVAADYNLDTQILTVTYKPKKVTEDQIHKILNEVGYDTEKSTCTEEQYLRTHGCCRYREMEKH